MSPEQAKLAIREQAMLYSKRVMQGRINESAVEALLRADADAFSDSHAMSGIVLEHGMNIYRTFNGAKT